MLTLQSMRMRTEYMLEQIRRDAIDATLEQFKAATRHYYETCEGGDKVTELYKELEKLGANMDAVFDIDWDIREEVFGA